MGGLRRAPVETAHRFSAPALLVSCIGTHSNSLKPHGSNVGIGILLFLFSRLIAPITIC
jgi:hypothetical protein